MTLKCRAAHCLYLKPPVELVKSPQLFSEHVLALVIRKGEDLMMSMELQLVEALCGFKKPVQALDNRTLLITSHPGAKLPL